MPFGDWGGEPGISPGKEEEKGARRHKEATMSVPGVSTRR